MRTRHNNIASRTVSRSASSVTATHVYCSGSPPSSTSSQAIAALSFISAGRDERMSDALGKGKPHKVIHRRFAYDISDNIGSTVFANTVGGRSCVTTYVCPNNWADSCKYFSDYHAWNVDSDSSVPVDWALNMSVNEASMKNDVLEDARQLKADILLNLIEANQIWPSIHSLTTSLPILAKEWKKVRKVVKTASGGFLAWKFGVSPILQDMMAVQRYLPRLQRDVKRHADGDTQRFSRSADGTAVPPSSDYGVNWAGASSAYSRQCLVSQAPQLRYVLSVKPNTKYLTSFFNSADHFMSRFASSPASLTWEKIPFSFVLDWFVDLRGVLASLDKAVGNSPYQIVSFTRSYKYELSTAGYVDNKSPCNGATIQSYREFIHEYKHYERSVVSAGNLPVWNPRFGKNQAGISAALIAQKLSPLISKRLVVNLGPRFF